MAYAQRAKLIRRSRRVEYRLAGMFAWNNFDVRFWSFQSKNGVAASGWNADGDVLLVFSAALIRKMQIDPVDLCWPAARSGRALNYVA